MPPQNNFQQQQQGRRLVTNHQQRNKVTCNKNEEEKYQHPNSPMTKKIIMTKKDLVFQSKGPEDTVGYRNWGFPGYLTEEEYAVYVSFSWLFLWMLSYQTVAKRVQPMAMVV